jgi:hypothetical protein
MSWQPYLSPTHYLNVRVHVLNASAETDIYAMALFSLSDRNCHKLKKKKKKKKKKKFEAFFSRNRSNPQFVRQVEIFKFENEIRDMRAK